MKSWKKISIFCLLCIILLLGYLMPEAVNILQDRQIDGRVETVSAESTELQMGSDLSLSEKFSVIDHASSSVDLESAQNMEYESAEECLNAELAKLFPSTAKDPFSVSGFSETEHTITLYVYEEKSVLLWDFDLESNEGDQIHLLLDDDSGLILSFTYQPKSESVKDLFETIEESCSMTANDYLDSLATRYVEYLRASYNLSGTEISYEWALDELENLLGDSDNIPDILKNADADSADADENTDADEGSADAGEDTDAGEGSADAGGDTGAGEGSAQNESGQKTDPLWKNSSDSLRNYNPSADTSSQESFSGSDTDSDSIDKAVVNQWKTCVHFSRNDEETYTLELILEKDLLTIHNTE